MATSSLYGKVTTELGSIGEDEPVFIIRARDVAAPAAIRAYISASIEAGSPSTHVAMVMDALDDVHRWQGDHAAAVKVPKSKRRGGMADA